MQTLRVRHLLFQHFKLDLFEIMNRSNIPFITEREQSYQNAE